MEVIFKSMDLNDLEKTIDLCNLCFDETTDYEYAKQVFLENQNDANSIYINGVINGEVIAHAKLTLIRTIYKPMRTFGILNHVCVHPSYRRHHIATYLLNVLFDTAKRRGCSDIELWSKNFRTAAHSCYHDYGFEVMDAKFFTKEVQ